MNDLTPEEYAELESVPSGWNRIGDLPSGSRFRAHPRADLEWIVQGSDTIDKLFGNQRVECHVLTNPARWTDAPAGMSVWVDSFPDEPCGDCGAVCDPAGRCLNL